MAKKPVALSLFWRTFSLLAFLMVAVIAAWWLIFHNLTFPTSPCSTGENTLAENLGQSDPDLLFIELILISLVLVATLGISALMARFINQPLRALSFAASRVREGEYESLLDENTMTSEIRQVNMGFNRMARELAKIEEDRAVMLAGISHDLRTPLARLRLEAEMSVQDEEARLHIAQDIDQLNAIIDKFMDYARPGKVELRPVNLSAVLDREKAAFRHACLIEITSKISQKACVMADDIELGRVLQNLFENSLRYGRSVESGVAQVTLTYAHSGPWGVVSVRDHGPGIDPKKLDQVMAPFYRGDMARTAATGAGLGLTIVEKAIQRMGGSLELENATDGGLVAFIRLRRAPDG